MTFEQADDPGRKRKYHSDACKQAAWRQRTGRNGHEAAQERARREQERRERQAWQARERRRQEREERARRAARGGDHDWLHPRQTDTTTQARARARAAKLVERATHPGTNAHEATACHEKAETLRAKHGL